MVVCDNCYHPHDYSDEPCASCGCEEMLHLAPEIQIVEAVIPKPGDTLVVCTKESLSREILVNMRGALEEYFSSTGVKVFIIAADEIFLLSPNLEKEFPSDDHTG